MDLVVRTLEILLIFFSGLGDNPAVARLTTHGQSPFLSFILFFYDPREDEGYNGHTHSIWRVKVSVMLRKRKAVLGLNGSEQLVLLEMVQVWFPAPTWSYCQ